MGFLMCNMAGRYVDELGATHREKPSYLVFSKCNQYLKFKCSLKNVCESGELLSKSLKRTTFEEP